MEAGYIGKGGETMLEIIRDGLTELTDAEVEAVSGGQNAIGGAGGAGGNGGNFSFAITNSGNGGAGGDGGDATATDAPATDTL